MDIYTYMYMYVATRRYHCNTAYMQRAIVRDINLVLVFGSLAGIIDLLRNCHIMFVTI